MYRVACAMLLWGGIASLPLRASPAHAQHRDFLLVREGDRVAIGAFDWGASTALVPTYLRAGAFEYAEQDYAVANNPGFNAVEEPPDGYAPLPGGREVAFSLVPVSDLGANLVYWSGELPVAFERATGESFLWASKAGGRARVDGGDERVEGFVLASTSESGVFHEHIELVLLGAESEEPGDADVPPRPGIYALAIAFHVDGLEEAEPAYLVMQHGDVLDDSLETAERWVRDEWLEPGHRGEEEPTPAEEPSPVRDCTWIGPGTLGPGLVEHSCFHAERGPFATVASTPMATETANVDSVHTHFTVSLPDGVGIVTYEPKREGKWAVFSDLESSPVLTDASGNALPVLLEHTVAGCDGLPWVRVYDLAARERYSLRYDVSEPPADGAAVVIEKLSDFDTRYGLDADGDGFGDPDRVVVTPCSPSDDYVANVDDCDDDDPSVHPDVPGACEPNDGCAEPTRDAGAACGPPDDAGADGKKRAGGGCSTSGRTATPTWALILGLWALLRLRRARGTVAAGVLLSLVSAPVARAEHIDILLAQRRGRIETGAYDFGKAAASMPRAVYARAFETLDDEQVSGNDPGMAAVNDPPAPWSALPPDAPATIGPGLQAGQITPLTFWDGEGEVRFAPTPPSLALEVTLGGLFGPQSSFSLDGSGAAGEEFVFTTTDAHGALHQHLDLAVSNTGGVRPPAGVYLLRLRFEVADLEPSPPVAVMLHHGVTDGAVDRATRCAADYLAPDCDDGIDNDGDGLADLDDPGCRDPSDLSELPDCDDGLDNDGDGETDVEDGACSDSEGGSECDDSPCPPIPATWTCAGALAAPADAGLGQAPDADADPGTLDGSEMAAPDQDAGADAGGPDATSDDDAWADNDATVDDASMSAAERPSGSPGCSLAPPASGHAGWSWWFAAVAAIACRALRQRNRS